MVIKVDDAKPEQDTAWYSSGDTNTMTTGDSRMVEQYSEVPQLVGRTQVGLRSAPLSSPPLYDWRMDTERGHSAHPFGSPQEGDTYTRDGDAYYKLGGVPFCSP